MSALDAKVQHHLDALVEQYRSEDTIEADARIRARREFGASPLVKDQCRDESRWTWLTGLKQDVVFGWRMIRKRRWCLARAESRAERTYSGTSGSDYLIDGAMVADFFSGAGYAALREAAKPVGKLAAYMYPESLSFTYQGRTEVIEARPVAEPFRCPNICEKVNLRLSVGGLRNLLQFFGYLD